MNSRFWLFLLILTISEGCYRENSIYKYAEPKNLKDGISIGTFNSVKVDSILFYDFFRALPPPRIHKLSSFLLMKDNTLVLENYWNGFNSEKTHDLRSATKSITSILLGIAIDKGFIKNEDELIVKYLGDYANSLGDKTLTLKDFLNMDSGLECDDWKTGSVGNEEKMYKKKDWIDFVVRLPKVSTKPNYAVYCTGGVVLLGFAIQQASGMRLDDFAKKYLFNPLSINEYSWEYFDKKTKVDAGGHLCLRPRDLLKIGKMILNDGKYNNQQIVSSGWISKSKKSLIKFPPNEEYGFLWWKNSFELKNKTYEFFYALGNGGQVLLLLPSENIIAVFTGENYNNPNGLLPLEIVKKVILPSIK